MTPGKLVSQRLHNKSLSNDLIISLRVLKEWNRIALILILKTQIGTVLQRILRADFIKVMIQWP